MIDRRPELPHEAQNSDLVPMPDPRGAYAAQVDILRAAVWRAMGEISNDGADAAHETLAAAYALSERSSDVMPPASKMAFPRKRVRLVRPGYLGIMISAQGPEYVMPISEANDLVGLIYRAKHDGEAND